MKISAPAKINLFLDITGRRKDGYHTLNTLFQTVSLCDELELLPGRTAGDKIKLTLSGETASAPSLPMDENNIICKAVRLFSQEFGMNFSASIRLKKRIPVQAGLGGGSSDAAATLLLCQKLFLRNKNSAKIDETLKKLALRLGADVPFFLKKGCVQALGIGERLKAVHPGPKFWAVLVKPEVGCPTKEVYRWFDRAQTDPKKRHNLLTFRSNINKILHLIKRKKGVQEWGPYLFNAFEPVVFEKIPELERIKRLLLDQGALGASLSGSGSALYGIAGSESEGKKLLAKVRKLGLKSWLTASVFSS